MFYSLLLSLFLMCIEIQADTDFHKRFVAVSIPKCGTTLLYKCLSMLTGLSDVHACMWHMGNKWAASASIENYWEKAFPANHELPSHNFIKCCLSNDICTFFIYRDPRDQIVSAAHWLKTQEPKARKMSMNDLIMDLINDSCSWFWINFKGFNMPKEHDINVFFRSFMKWGDYSVVHMIKFEDLIGKKGGGSFNAQVETIIQIARFMDLNIEKEKAHDIAKNLFGGTRTFYKGKIGSWKEYFTPQHIDVFKNKAGQLLIDLGYEKNFDW